MTLNRILVTPRSLTRDGHPALDRLSRMGCELILTSPGVQPGEAELLEKLPGCSGYLAGVETVSASVLEAAASSLQVISRYGSGVDNVDLEAAERLGIRVVRAASANADGVAELTVGLLFALARSIPLSDARMKEGKWLRAGGVELAGKTLGLIGLGAIGSRVGTLAEGIGMRVTGYDPHLSAGHLPSESLERVGSLDEIWTGADFISLHCPPHADGSPLVDTEALERMKDGVFLINTARGELLDEAAVLAGLQDQKIAGLAIDAFRSEPPGEAPLVLHERTIATPHLGAATRESMDRTAGLAVENLCHYLGLDQG